MMRLEQAAKGPCHSAKTIRRHVKGPMRGDTLALPMLPSNLQRCSAPRLAREGSRLSAARPPRLTAEVSRFRRLERSALSLCCAEMATVCGAAGDHAEEPSWR